jgi:protein TonB
MKNNHSIYTLILVIFLIFLSAITVNAQKDDSTRSKIKAMGTVMVNTPPQFPGGDSARIKFLTDNLKYPEEAIKLGIQGKVFVTFTVKVDGSINDVKVQRGIGGGCDEEAVRVIKKMPNWSPAIMNGTKVSYQLTFPIKFAPVSDTQKDPKKPIVH